MSSESQRQQLNALIKRRLELIEFEAEINYNLAHGDADKYLSDPDLNGEYPVVVALDIEPLTLLAERVQAVGGAATVFVRRADGVAVLTAGRGTCLDVPEALDLSHEEWHSGAATIGMFLSLLERHQHGVILPDHFPDAESVTSVKIRNRSVVLQTVPA